MITATNLARCDAKYITKPAIIMIIGLKLLRKLDGASFSSGFEASSAIAEDISNRTIKAIAAFMINF